MTAQLVVLDVGHGNAAVYIEANKLAIIDGGPDHTLTDFVVENGSHTISSIFISHADDDHLRGVLQLLESNPELTVEQIFVNPAQAKNTELWISFCTEIERLESAGSAILTSLTRSSPGTVQIGQARVEVLSPPPSRILSEARDNRWSAVLRLHDEQAAVAMFCADADSIAIDLLIASHNDLMTPILVFPHHGGGLGVRDPTKAAAKLLDAVDPGLVLFSMGRARFNNPLADLVSTIVAHGDHRIACTQLSRRCSSQVFPARDVHESSAGKSSGASCLGTFVLNLPFDGNFPLQSHEAFVDSILEGGAKPMCRLPLHRLTPAGGSIT